MNNILCSKCNASYQTFYLAGNSVMCQPMFDSAFCIPQHFAAGSYNAKKQLGLDGGKTSNKVVKKKLKSCFSLRAWCEWNLVSYLLFCSLLHKTFAVYLYLPPIPKHLVKDLRLDNSHLLGHLPLFTHAKPCVSVTLTLLIRFSCVTQLLSWTTEIPWPITCSWLQIRTRFVFDL